MSHSLKPKKSLGQHFLRDRNMILKIADAITAQPGDRVVEIGPGDGALTFELHERYPDLFAIELDQRMVAHLKENIPELNIAREDVLKTNWELISGGKPIHVVGNLPYNITSQILFSVAENRQYVETALFMMQKEVAKRIVAEPGNKEYGILSVQLQLMSTPEILFDVPPTVFYPPPKVDSAIVKLTFNKPALKCSDEHLKKVVRMAFNQRRKKLKNALKRLDADLPEDEFDFSLRAEALPPETYEKMTARFEHLGII